jgi:hypothetical protein
MLDTLGDFAALIEVLWMPPAELDRIGDTFAVELYELASETLVPLEPSGGMRLSDFTAGGRFYPNDIVLRRKRPA